MQRFYTELDHRKFGAAKMRDVVSMIVSDLAGMHTTSQKATVLMPVPDKDYSDITGVCFYQPYVLAQELHVSASYLHLSLCMAVLMHGMRFLTCILCAIPPWLVAAVVFGDGLQQALAALRKNMGHTAVVLRPEGMSDEELMAEDNMKGTPSLPPGFEVKPDVASTDGGPAAGGASGRPEGRPGGPQEDPVEKVKKTCTKFLRRSILAQRFFLMLDALRLLRSRQSPGLFGAGTQRVHSMRPGEPGHYKGMQLCMPGAPVSGPSVVGGPVSGIEVKQEGAAAGPGPGLSTGAGTQHQGPQAARNQFLPEELPGFHASAALKQCAELVAPHHELTLNELRQRWEVELQANYSLPAVGPLKDEASLLAFVQEIAAGVAHLVDGAQQPPNEGMSPFRLLLPANGSSGSDGAEATGAGAAAAGVVDGAGKDDSKDGAGKLQGGDGALMSAGAGGAAPMEGVLKEEAPPEKELGAGEAAAVAAAAAAAGGAGDAGAWRLRPVLGNLWDLKKIQEVWNLLRNVLLEHAYAATPDRCGGVEGGLTGGHDS